MPRVGVTRVHAIQSRTSFDVTVIGAGLSGLAAAVRLSLDGARVAIFERSKIPGGRCSSFVDVKTGDVVDNGQHLLLGAYRNTLQYLALIGTRQYLRAVPRLRLPFHHPEKGFSHFELPNLPRPFNVVAGMLSFNLLSTFERVRLLNVGRALRSWDRSLEERLSRMTVKRWLDDLHQSKNARESLWYPIAISALNEVPERASALLFARALSAAFMGDNADATLLLPTVGQSSLYVDTAEQLIASRKGSVVRGTAVASLVVAKGAACGVRLGNGKEVKSPVVISAVPYFSLCDILPDRLVASKPFSDLTKLDSSPIICIHLWFDKEFFDGEYLGVIGKRLQWVFNRSRIVGGKKGLSCISAVISGARDLVQRSKKELIAGAAEDLRAVFPGSKGSTLVHALVIKEKRATFSPTNDAEPFRPGAETPVKNFYLAGDWTKTGLPATIESAVASGFMAARLAMRSAG